MLRSIDIVEFVPTRSPGTARFFYERTLGLRFVSNDQFALVFDANWVTVRVVDVSPIPAFTPASFAIVGWSVVDITKTVEALQKQASRSSGTPGCGRTSSAFGTRQAERRWRGSRIRTETCFR